MRKSLMYLLIVFAAMCIYCLSSCARGISTYDAANGRAKCGRYVR